MLLRISFQIPVNRILGILQNVWGLVRRSTKTEVLTLEHQTNPPLTIHEASVLRLYIRSLSYLIVTTGSVFRFFSNSFASFACMISMGLGVLPKIGASSKARSFLKALLYP